MIRRFFIIAYLLLSAAIAYLLLLVTKKRSQSCLVYADFGKSGGTRTYFFYLVEYLSARQFDIKVMLTKEQCDDEVMALQSKFPFVIQLVDFEIQRTKFEGTVFYKKNQENFIYHLRELIFFWKYLRLSKCSLLVITESTPEVLLVLFLTPVKLLYILHTVATDKLDWLKQKILNACLSGNKKIITVSEFSKKSMRQNWVDGSKEKYIEVVHNFYEPFIHNISPLTHTTHTGKAVLTIGSLGHHKNPLLWIDVAKEVIRQYHGEISFVWAGDGILLEQCKAECSQYENIQFIGVSKNVEQLYLDCDVYFQPSILESHGIAVLGAMYFEKACVVSNRQGLPESVINDVTGLIVPIEDLHQSVNAILTLLNDPQKATAFGKAAKEKQQKDFVKTKWNQTMDFIFDGACGKQEKHNHISV